MDTKKRSEDTQASKLNQLEQGYYDICSTLTPHHWQPPAPQPHTVEVGFSASLHHLPLVVATK
jgi:hypothetical protein